MSEIDDKYRMKSTYHRTEDAAKKRIKRLTKNKGYRVKQEPRYSQKYSAWVVNYTRRGPVEVKT